MNKAEWIKIAMQRFEGRLVRYTARFVDLNEARDIVQETFLRLWQQDADKVQGHLAEWLFTVCRNQALDRRRKDKRLSRVSGEHLEQMVDPKQDLENSEQGIFKLLHRLPEPQQEVIRLKFQEDLSYKQISAITGHSVSYVGVLIHTAMTSLRQELEVKS